jgi:pyridoxamine 5'-phosphate oxidase
MSTMTEPLAAPFELFAAWFAEAKAAEPVDPNAMTVATCTPGAVPSARIVLLKDWDARGFVFYTNKQGRKGGELAANPQAALLFHWKSLARQVRIEGPVEHVTEAEADAYYNSRARVSRIGAWASDQSRPLDSRAELERRVADYEARYPGEAIPRPPYWSGYRVIPKRIEFWQDMPFRLHDRNVFTRTADSWTRGKLFP